MTKFWAVVTVLVIVSIVVLVTGNVSSNTNVEVTELETECRVSDTDQTDVVLREDKLIFRGNFPVEDTDSELNYDYSIRNNNIVLNIRSEPTRKNINFVDDCLGSVVYEASSGQLEPGAYVVKIKHNGEMSYSSVIRVV